MSEYNRWGFWGTSAWSGFILALFLATQIAFIALYAEHNRQGQDIEAAPDIAALQQDGDLLAFSTFLTTLVCVPIILGIIKLKRGSRLADYLPLAVPPGRTLAFWLLGMALLIAVYDATAWFLGKPIVPEFMQQVYASADSKVLFWAAVILAAPLFEETFFRGFVLSGLSRSRLGAAGAVVLASLAWAALHVQYEAYDVAAIFIFGLVLGAARIKTGSLFTPLLLHALANTVATIETVVSLGGT